MCFLEHSTPAEHPAVTVVSTDIGRTVADLRAQPGRDIWLFGGGNLFGSLLAAGVVDQIEIAVMPVVLGGGIPLVSTGTPRSQTRADSLGELARRNRQPPV